MYEIIMTLSLFGAIVGVISIASYAYNYCAEANDKARRTGERIIILQFRILNEDIQFCASP